MLQIGPNFRTNVDVTFCYKSLKDHHQITLELELITSDEVIGQLKEVFKREFRIKATDDLVDISVATPYDKKPVRSAQDVFLNIHTPIHPTFLKILRPTIRLIFTVRGHLWKDGQGFWISQTDYDAWQKKDQARKEADKMRFQRNVQIMEEQLEMREIIEKQAKDIAFLMKEMEILKMENEKRDQKQCCCKLMKSNDSLVEFDEMEIAEAVEDLSLEQE